MKAHLCWQIPRQWTVPLILARYWTNRTPSTGWSITVTSFTAGDNFSPAFTSASTNSTSHQHSKQHTSTPSTRLSACLAMPICTVQLLLKQLWSDSLTRIRNKLHRKRSETIGSHTILGYLGFGAISGYLATPSVIFLLSNPDFL